jgi:hypothetical protein
VADSTTGLGSVSPVTRVQALKLNLRRRFQGTVTKSARRAGWTGLRFSVMAELQKVVLVCSVFHESSIGFVGAQKAITLGSSGPTPTGGSVPITAQPGLTIAPTYLAGWSIFFSWWYPEPVSYFGRGAVSGPV